MKDVFTKIYHDNEWKSDESVSGQGSTLDQTHLIRRELPQLFEKFQVKTLLDIPCGDMNWIADIITGLDYVGADIVTEIIDDNRKRFPELRFEVLDITRNELPQADMLLVRDLFGHFSDVDLKLAIDNVKRSNIKYLLATTFPSSFNTIRITTGQWRALNLDYYCGLPASIYTLNEGNQLFKDKCLGLWQLR